MTRIALAFAALLVSACAVAEAPGVNARPNPSVGAWEVFSQIRFAVFSEDGGRTHSLMLTCSGADALRIYHRLPATGEHYSGSLPLTLRSGALTAALPGEAHVMRATPPPDLRGALGPVEGVEVSAVAPADAPVIASFLSTGALEAQSGEHLTRADANASERAAVGRLIERCGESPALPPDHHAVSPAPSN